MKITITRARNAGLSLPAATLFECASFYWPKAKVKREGRTWLVFTKPEWCEIAKLTVWQQRRAFAELRDSGIFVVGKYKWKGAATTFTAINFDKFLRIEAQKPPIPLGGFNPVGRLKTSQPNLPTGSKKPPNPYYLKERKISKKEYLERSYSLRFVVPRAANENAEAETERENVIKIFPTPVLVGTQKLEALKMNVSEVKQKLEAVIASQMSAAKTVVADSGDKIGQLHNQWCILTSSADNHVSMKMTGKAIGCLKSLVAHAPAGTASQILAEVATNWSSFVYFLESEHGAYKLSKSPDLFVFTKYHNQAVTFWKKKAIEVAKAAQKAAKQAEELQLIAQAPKIDPGQLEAWAAEEFMQFWIAGNGPLLEADKAKFDAKWKIHRPSICKRILAAWTLCQEQGLPYPAPIAQAKAA